MRGVAVAVVEVVDVPVVVHASVFAIGGADVGVIVVDGVRNHGVVPSGFVGRVGGLAAWLTASAAMLAAPEVHPSLLGFALLQLLQYG